MYDFSKTLVRCSSIYNIMTSDRKRSGMEMWQDACAQIVKQRLAYEKMKKKDGPRGEKLTDDIERLEMLIPILEMDKDKPEPLSAGCKSYMTALYAAEKYGKWSYVRDNGNKYTSKGKEAEEDAITLTSRLDKQLYMKHEGRLENEFLCGHPDIIVPGEDGSPEKIIDIKAPWDVETFFTNLGKEVLPNYYWQIQGYMALTDAKFGEVHFCLVNTPAHIIEEEKYKLAKKLNAVTSENPEYKIAEARMINNLTFDDMPLEDKRIKILISRNDEDIQKIYERVGKCREYLVEIEKLHLGIENTINLPETMKETE